ncbi:MULTISPECIES: aminoglycoside phosphotransferase family protein [Metabacillus]|uniref:Aminoglycoside phosphotransferase family protein n=1 Tax=Metabacillus hrfriensis TaxID=3048891 RepID=A0ACD4RH17_9BACI|nr:MULTISPECIES: aminoglycoside phosphotransferase family protein [Metabacillus]UAL54053.1 aminoglycoside phosphotransferase family protein [Metabacillus dongyingensis]USK30370.1 aminoglycoside phosphotransferase family protein [Bacillus sp. CMF21]WHZ59619.1 aminoglycoside phosphotransferase family protein [Metabacillus sp. CT-WN-B3]
MNLSSEFKQTIIGVHGDSGEAWLRELPYHIARCEQTYGLKIGDPYKLTYHYVAQASMENGEEAVVKIGLPNHKDLIAECIALKIMGSGNGMVKLIDDHLNQGLLILEKLNPGTMLSEVNSDETAVSIASSVMKKIWQPYAGDHDFPHLSDWMAGLRRVEQNIIAEKWIHKAEILFDDLINSSTNPILLHGDLHQDNILKKGKDWLAIDPKGVIGEAEYEVTSFSKNYLFDKKNPKDVLRKRLDLFEKELGLDRTRMIGWGFCQAVLSACWCLEDGAACFEENLHLAEMYDVMM